jgi:diguanylate cyclase (GGDEF)-like protein/PAS domain S-box-containing protein
MSRFRISFQIAICLALLSTTAIVVAEALDLLPNRTRITVNARIAVCETLAMHCSQLVNIHGEQAIESTLQQLQNRSDDMLSVALRRADGKVVASAGDHALHWQGTTSGHSTDSQIYVPITQGKKQWGALEVAFRPLRFTGWLAALDFDLYRLVLFAAGFNGLLFIYYLSKVLTELDPQRSMPQRVRSALDTLVEGLLVLDQRGRIVMANRAFTALTGQSAETLQGRRASDLPWKVSEGDFIAPWEDVLETREEKKGVSLSLPGGVTAGDDRTFVVNAAPILDAKGVNRGVLASFDDITALENKKRELMHMLAVLQESRERISRQNEELKYLATRDPMTGCLNRRSFFEQFEAIWEMAQTRQSDLACIMVDVDHFKSVNDNHGHSTGDEVLKKVASALLSSVNTTGLVCRFGGEEFCVLLPNCSIEVATEAAERFRMAVAALEFPQLSCTASFGVSANKLGAASPQAMLDEADKCLYFSKRNGRNRVSSWDKVPHDITVEESKVRRTREETPAPAESQVPFQAVTSLMAALSYRDPDTAAHCQRVADLAVATSRGLISAREAYLLEIAALLHDIGKIGVPDSILLKAGALTRDEWEIMHLNTRMGVEIVNASFQSPALVEMVRYHHCRYGGDPAAPQLPVGEQIPLGGRLICICDAFDSMITDRVYRKGRTRDEAFAELRRMAGVQFDPDLVERFIETISQRPDRSWQSTGAMSQELAINLGLQTERLALAIDDQDIRTVKALSSHLEATAAKHGVEDIRVVAASLVQQTEKDPDLQRMVQQLHEIIDLSLEAQKQALRPNAEWLQAVDRRKRLAGVTRPPQQT